MLLYESLVKTDLLLGVLLTVLCPLGLLFFGVGHAALRKRLLAYWRVSALLMITVYLFIAQLPVAFVTGTLARAAILVVLWRGDGLLGDRRFAAMGSHWAARAFRLWRGIMTAYCLVGVLFTLPLVACSWPSGWDFCNVWPDTLWFFHFYFHPHLSLRTAGVLAQIGLGLYAFYALLVLRSIRKTRRSY